MSAPLVPAAIVLVALVWSGVAPHDRLVWWLETLPVTVFGAAIALRWRRFPWTPVSLWCIVAFALVLCLGGHYTYARVPLGDWARDAFGLARNHYDRVGHFLQGFTPALLARELYRRCTGMRPGAALFWSCTAVALAISAAYELVEWWTTLIVDPDAGLAFLGSQGDVWDAQWDMALALSGALLAQLLFARTQERQLARL